MRPVVAITKPEKKDIWAYSAVAAAVRLCGGYPFALTPGESNHSREVNGVIFGGGDDIFPMLYDDLPKQGHVYDRARDALEIATAKQATSEKIPTLGICRGAQLLNVVRGGTLHADVAAEYEDAAYPNGIFGKIFYRKAIFIETESKLARAVCDTEIEVNSLHKQAIKKVGDGLRSTAKEKNGVIQAIEDEDHPFFVGVQFHPEFLTYRADIRRLFKAFIAAAQARKPVKIDTVDDDTDAA